MKLRRSKRISKQPVEPTEWKPHQIVNLEEKDDVYMESILFISLVPDKKYSRNEAESTISLWIYREFREEFLYDDDP